jgi:hypothetical protein
MWFGPLERNTLHLWERVVLLCVSVALFKAELNLCEVEVVLYSRLPMLFIAQSTGELH